MTFKAPLIWGSGGPPSGETGGTHEASSRRELSIGAPPRSRDPRTNCEPCLRGPRTPEGAFSASHGYPHFASGPGRRELKTPSTDRIRHKWNVKDTVCRVVEFDVDPANLCWLLLNAFPSKDTKHNLDSRLGTQPYDIHPHSDHLNFGWRYCLSSGLRSGSYSHLTYEGGAIQKLTKTD